MQLIDTETGSHLWAERFENSVADLFDLQDQIVSRLANTLNAQLIDAEAQRAKRSNHPDVTDLYFQGRAHLNKEISFDHLMQAQGFFERALQLDPHHIEALFGCAVVGINSAGGFLTDDRTALLTAAEITVTKVLSLASNHAGAHSILGSVYAQTNRATQAIAKHEQALMLDRNLAYAHADIGLAKHYIGRGAEMEAHVREAFRVSPRDLRVYLWMGFVGFAKFFEGADAEAVTWLRRSVEANRNYALAHFYLATALAHLGALDEVRAAAQAGIALNPGFTVSRYRATAPSAHPKYLAGRERVYEGLRMAGVAEG